MKALNLAAALQLPDLPKHLQRVEKNLARLMRSDAKILNEPLARLSSVRGKRIRPSLVIAVASSVGEVNDSTIAAATAMELLHIASLVHDDIIDESPLRWNQTTIARKEGADVALITGDFLIARAFEQAALAGSEVAKCLASSFTTLCNGQALEMQTRYSLNRTTDEYFESIKGKTAELFAASCVLGAMSAEASKAELKALEKFGQHFGIGFQILDDLTDLISNPSEAGKTIGNDLLEGIYTLPVLLALDLASGKELRQLIKMKDFTAASKLLRTSEGYGRAVDEATEHIEEAKQALRTAQYPGFERFGNFADSFFAWSMQQLG